MIEKSKPQPWVPWHYVRGLQFGGDAIPPLNPHLNELAVLTTIAIKRMMYLPSKR